MTTINWLTLLVREIKYFTNFENKMYQFLLFFQPLMFLSIVYFLNEYRGDINDGRFVIASALISMWSYVLYSSGSALTSQKWSDTLKLLLVSPVSLSAILMTKVISNSFIAMFSMLLSFIYAKFIFNFKVEIASYTLFSIAILVLILSLSVMGLILAIVFVAFQNVYDYQNLILTPMVLMCGVFIPVEQFPLVVKVVSYIIPMTWGIKSVYEALQLSSPIYTTMTISILISLFYLLAAFFIIKRIELLLRKTGKLGAI
ncbi:ABC transporter permease [Robertmurraya kyonggiensis]|uniref:Transport permease protein n=1 Tax=Robertmurraya kyonggiensis TaxID=1037680 RepID=A0A4U1D982_9BACI|nr:ABC transporter permease [Robertmurraya kyonggiensis]TKC19099.1 ABC transporter permease [Robertmurraya kyonggiensis]